MNRAFLIILAPAALVAAAFLAVGWGYTISVPAGLLVLALAGIAFLLRRRNLGGRSFRAFCVPKGSAGSSDTTQQEKKGL